MNVISGMIKKSGGIFIHFIRFHSFKAMMCVMNKINNSEGKIKRNNVNDKHDV